MTTAAGSSVGARPTSGASWWPSFFETLLALAAIAALLPQFDRLSVDDSGRERRFADVAIAVGGLPERVLPALCGAYGTLAEPLVRERLCRSSELRGQAPAVTAMPPVIVDAFARTSRAFRRPLAAAEQRRAELRLQQREGLGDLLELDSAIESIDADLKPYVERYAHAAGCGAPSRPASAYRST